MHPFSFKLVYRTFLTLGLGGALVAAIPAPQKARDLSPSLKDLPRKFNVPGLSVAVISGGNLVASGAAGLRQVNATSPILTGDRFHLGSCTKRMTALMIYRLVDQHKLRLDSTLGESLPGIGMLDVYKKVTLSQLLQFEGGIQPYLFISPDKTPEVFRAKGSAEEQRTRFVSHVLQEKPVATPGSKAVYSNASYAVLACVASHATGKSWEELMKSNVFEPLHMESAGFGRPSLSSANSPRGHTRVGGGWEVEPAGYIHPASLSAAGDVSCSMPDFAKFAAEELRIAEGKSRLLSKSTAALMNKTSPVAEGRTFLGGAGAFTAGMTIWPRRDVAVVVGVNSGEGEQLCTAVSRAAEQNVVEGKPFTLAVSSRPQSYAFMLGLGPNGSVMVGGVQPGGIAALAGLHEGDQIVEMNGKEIGQIPEDQRFGALRGKALTLKVNRNGQLLKIRMELPPQ